MALLRAGIVGLLLVALAAQVAQASQIPVLTDAGTHGYAYPNCPTTQTQDTVTISNIASTETLSGYLQTEQVVPVSTTYPDGRRIIQKYGVGASGPANFGQVVTWPAFNDPTVLANAIPQPDGTGTIEYHLDVAVDVYDGGNFVITLGPGQDYDVFCVGNPNPPPPPPPTNFGTRTIGYWKTHTTSWPTTTITLGTSTYNTGNPADKAYLIGLLQNANAKDPTYMLAAQLIGAELNVASGGPATGLVAQGISQLTATPVGSNPTKALKDQVTALSDQLDKYNQSQDKG